MFIELDSEVNEKISELARLHRRSKRMEVTHALDMYVKDYTLANVVGTDGEETTT